MACQYRRKASLISTPPAFHSSRKKPGFGPLLLCSIMSLLLDLMALDASITELFKRSGMPTLTTSTSSSTLADYTTPVVTVPASTDNPFIERTSKPSGTVFIAVGSVVGFILLAVLSFYAVRSILASKIAKRAVAGEKSTYGYHGGNTLGLNFNSTEYRGSVASVPLLNAGGARSIFRGDDSPAYGDATSNHDVTEMFVSPTRQVMSHSRQKSQNWDGSVSTASLYGKLGVGMNLPVPATSRYSQLMPHLYLNDNADDSGIFSVDSSQAGEVPNAERPGKRKTVPSMYLDDLIDK